MKITAQQLGFLMVILQDSCERDIRGAFSLPIDTRCKLLNQILTQQDNALVEVGETVKALEAKAHA